MTIDVPVGTTEPTEIQTVVATESPEVVEPGKDAEAEQKAEKTEAEILREEKARIERQMQRRIDKLTKKLNEVSYQQPVQQQAQQQGQDADEPRYTEQEVQRKAAEMLEVRTIAQRANDIAASGEKEFADFGDKVRAVMSEVELFDQRGRMTPLMEIIAEADKPHAVLHYLGSNPEVAEELAALPLAKQARRLTQIEAELAKPKEPPAKQVSKAPKPIEPVKPAGRASDEPPIEDTKAWIEWSNRQDALKRSRR